MEAEISNQRQQRARDSKLGFEFIPRSAKEEADRLTKKWCQKRNLSTLLMSFQCSFAFCTLEFLIYTTVP